MAPQAGFWGGREPKLDVVQRGAEWQVGRVTTWVWGVTPCFFIKLLVGTGSKAGSPELSR